MCLSTLVALSIALILAPSDATQITLMTEEKVVIVKKLKNGIWDVEPPPGTHRREGIYTHIKMDRTIMERTYPELLEGPLKMATDRIDFLDMVLQNASKINWKKNGTYPTRKKNAEGGKVTAGGDISIKHIENGFELSQATDSESFIERKITVTWKKF